MASRTVMVGLLGRFDGAGRLRTAEYENLLHEIRNNRDRYQCERACPVGVQAGTDQYRNEQGVEQEDESPEGSEAEDKPPVAITEHQAPMRAKAEQYAEDQCPKVGRDEPQPDVEKRGIRRIAEAGVQGTDEQKPDELDIQRLEHVFDLTRRQDRKLKFCITFTMMCRYLIIGYQ